jgi:hypothetical protein
MTACALIIPIAGLGLFGLLCETAPLWDDVRQKPADATDAAGERA